MTDKHRLQMSLSFWLGLHSSWDPINCDSLFHIKRHEVLWLVFSFYFFTIIMRNIIDDSIPSLFVMIFPLTWSKLFCSVMQNLSVNET